MRWVRQEDDRGCGPAVLAMLTGHSYEQVKAAISADAAGSGHLGDWTKEGVTYHAMDRYLAKAGYAVQRLVRNMGGEWPPRPWAPMHFASVVNSGGIHFVAMDADGKVLDPLHEAPRTFDDWEKVNNVVGVVPVSIEGDPGPRSSGVEASKWCGECGLELRPGTPPSVWTGHVHKPVAAEVMDAAWSIYALLEGMKEVGEPEQIRRASNGLNQTLERAGITEQAVRMYGQSATEGSRS